MVEALFIELPFFNFYINNSRYDSMSTMLLCNLAINLLSSLRAAQHLEQYSV